MKIHKFKGKIYNVDDENFLLDHEKWDGDFAVGMAKILGINNGLTDQHWAVINFIRRKFNETGACPVVNETMHALRLDMKSLQKLFPSGYLRGSCLIAGITYMYGWVYYFEEPYPVTLTTDSEEKQALKNEEKIYRVDLFGSLVDPSEWDEDFAVRKAYEMNIKSGLTKKHWKVINFLRESYARNKKIPTIYECCEANQINAEEFVELFPTGYHRGAVKIAGLPTFGKRPR